MNDRKELRKARLSLLGDLNRLEANHCRTCPKRNTSYENCKPCDIYGKIRHIGKALEGEVQVGAKKNPEIEKRNEEILQRLLNGEKPVKVAKEYHVSAAVVHQLRYKNKHLFEKAGEDMIREKEVHKEVKPVEAKKTVEPVLERKPVIESDEMVELRAKINHLINDLKKKDERLEELSNMSKTEIERLDAVIQEKLGEIEDLKNDKNNLERHISNLEDNRNSEELQKAYDDYLNEAEKCKRLKSQVQDLLTVDTMNALLMEQNLMFRKRLNDFVDGNSL